MPTTNDPSNSIIAKIIEWSIKNTMLIMVGVIVISTYGWISLQKTPLDAIPDLSDTQVIVRTDFTGQSPQIIEDQITYPLSTIMLGLPKTKDVRGFSMFGTSFVYIIFQDDVDQYWARSRVIEALSKIQGNLPAAAKPQIGPDATGAGWVYQYALIDQSGEYDLADLRTLQDWFLKFELATVDGVSEVASVGGFVREYQILIDPNRLRSFDVAIHRIHDALNKASAERGGRTIEQGETEYIIRSKGYVESSGDLEHVVVYSNSGNPVELSDIARIVEGPALRRGITELNGNGEVVSGIIIMRSGENALNVVNRVKNKIEQIKHGLPEGVEIVPVYDRAPLINGAVSYLTDTLIKEGIAVALVIFIFLLHVRSVFVALVTLPLGVLGAFIIMAQQGITANIISLGGIAIAIGTMVDASIVMVENAHRKLAKLPKSANKQKRKEAILEAAKEVGPGLFFTLLIITISFLPVLALTGQSYRLFSPLAFTKTYVLAFAAFLSITAIPVLMIWFLKGSIRKAEDNPINKYLASIHKYILNLAIKKYKLTIAIALLLFISVVIPLTKSGSEFMPALYEGELLYMPTTLPGVSVTKAKEILQITNRLIKTVPEVERVFGKAGRSDTATDPAPLTMIETWIHLKPRHEWRKDLTPEKLIDDLNNRVKLPGLVNSWGYPIKIRMDMITTGIRTPVGIKVSGDNLTEINNVARNIESVLTNVEGTRSVFADRVIGGKYLEIIPKRKALARYDIDLLSFQQVVETALGGMKISEAFKGRERYSIMIRYDHQFRKNPNDLANILIPQPPFLTAPGKKPRSHIPLGELAHIRFVEGPPMIRSENARLTGWVFVDIKDRDIGGYVEEARQIVNEKVALPTGYSVTWSGQFEQMLEAKKQLTIAIPAAILAIFVLLMVYFNRIDRTLIVMLSLPFALVGGFWAIYLADFNNSVATSVGFIALAGLAVETATIMLVYIDLQIKEEQPKTLKNLEHAVMQGSLLRIRPVLMTVITEFAGLLPIFIFTGLGADVMRRIALPMIGGMITTTMLTLFFIPVIYYLWEGKHYKKRKEK